jgi:hypothetical protein
MGVDGDEEQGGEGAQGDTDRKTETDRVTPGAREPAHGISFLTG